MSDFGELLRRLRAVHDLQTAAEILEWDQETFMPIAATEARARQVATLREIAHERFTQDRTGELLEDLASEPYADDSFRGSLIREARRDYDRACKIPTALVAELAHASGRAKAAWRQAREADDFSHFEPHLARIVSLCIQKAEAVGYSEHPYDALLEEFEPGVRSSDVGRLFRALRVALVPIVQAIASQPSVSDTFLHVPYEKSIQWEFGKQVLDSIGYDLTRGRQDTSAHPFSTSFSTNDVRITTRIDENNLTSGLFSTLHEAGHAMYEQGIDPELEGTMLAQGTSLGMHESQSRLWENQIGRSQAFWKYFYKALQECFPVQLGAVPLDRFYRAVNRVAPTLIRVEADEVTYNLHIILRFELELMLVEEKIAPKELPGLWRDKMRTYLGVYPESNAEGVLQDIHWSLGAIGYFPTYTLGTLMSAQIYACAQVALADLDEYISRGHFSLLLDWLQANVHQWGRKLTAQQILHRLTGEGLSIDPWLSYVKEKYARIYGKLP